MACFLFNALGNSALFQRRIRAYVIVINVANICFALSARGAFVEKIDFFLFYFVFPFLKSLKFINVKQKRKE